MYKDTIHAFKPVLISWHFEKKIAEIHVKCFKTSIHLRKDYFKYMKIHANRAKPIYRNWRLSAINSSLDRFKPNSLYYLSYYLYISNSLVWIPYSVYFDNTVRSS